jgi:hypothetical protein
MPFALPEAGVMMDNRLEEQLERVRQLSARVAQIHEQLAQNTELITRDRMLAVSAPLQEVRDLRTWQRPEWEPEEPEPSVRREHTRRSPRSRADDRARRRPRNR